MRKISHNFTADDFEKLNENTDVRAVSAAIGYLGTWGMLVYPEAEISISGNEINAVYLKPDKTIGYTIVAVWHDDHFGFHS